MTAHHVIVGASAAGVSAAIGMREAGFEGRITLIDASSEIPYERPPLSKSLHAPGPLRPIIGPERYRELDIELLLGRRVSALDGSRRTVVLDGGDRMQPDAVLLATGLLPRRLGAPGEELAHIFSLRDAADAAKIIVQLNSGGPLVVVGGGFIGLEAAAGARMLGLDVTVIETQPLPLLGPLGSDMASALLRLHVDRGVRFRTGVGVASFVGERQVEEVVLDDGSSLPAAAVIVGVGVTPQDFLAQQAGADCDGGVLVDRHGRASDGWLWAAGDVARLPSPYVDGRQRIEHWDVALRHGAAVGAGMAGRPTEYGDVPYFWSDQFEHRLQMYGRPRRTDHVVLRHVEDEQVLAFWSRDHIVVAACALNAPKDLRAARALIERRVETDSVQLADPSVSLRRLASAQPV